jgi:hypothetical protein
VSQLLPEGWSLADAPYVWFESVRFALMALGFEELPSDERPPRRIWLDGKRLDDWWSEVKKNREAQTRGEDRHIEDPVDNTYRLVVE